VSIHAISKRYKSLCCVMSSLRTVVTDIFCLLLLQAEEINNMVFFEGPFKKGPFLGRLSLD